MKKPIIINVKVKPQYHWLQTVMLNVAIALTYGFLINLGVTLDSAAMQWAGFIMGSLFVIALVEKAVDDSLQGGIMTVDQARKKLDDLEKGGTALALAPDTGENK